MARRPVTLKVSAASRRNIKKAQLSRFRTREPRRVGAARNYLRGLTLRARRIV